jgi:hypothetical protein
MTMFATILNVILVLLGGGSNDLVGLVPTGAYWKSKDVTVSLEQLLHDIRPEKVADISRLISDLDADDPKVRNEASAKIAAFGPAALPQLEETAKNGNGEAATRARALIAQIHAASKSVAIRRLMAIRTVGEMKKTEALPALRALLTSQEMFEADYAKSAIARIEGKDAAVSHTPSVAERLADVALLPAKLDMVAQLAPPGGVDGSLDRLPIAEQEKSGLLEELTPILLHLLERVGNVRIDSITLGWYAAPPNQPGYGIFIVRGQYDHQSVAAALRGTAQSKEIGGAESFQIDDETALMLFSDTRAIYISAEPNGEVPADAMAAAVTNHSGDFEKNADLPKLVKSVDASSSFWCVCKITDGLRQLREEFRVFAVLEPFDTITISARGDPRHKQGADFQVEAVGKEPKAVEAAVNEARAQLKQAVATVRREERQMPALKPAAQLAQSIHVKADGAKATANGHLDGIPWVPADLQNRLQLDVEPDLNPPPQQ